jgi:hypothetical protein
MLKQMFANIHSEILGGGEDDEALDADLAG